MKIKTMLKRYAAENDCNVKDRVVVGFEFQFADRARIFHARMALVSFITMP